MKKYILSIAICFSLILLLSSCKKENQTKYVTLDESIQAGKTYSLDMSAYGNRDAEATITTQATHFSVSQIEMELSTQRNIYHFSSNDKQQDKEKIVLQVKGSKEHSGQCNHSNNDDNKTVITINMSVL